MSKQDNTTGNIAIGLAVAVLGFIVYKMVAGSSASAVTYTGTAPTAAQASNSAKLAQSTIPLLSNLFTSTTGNPTSSTNSSLWGSLSGVLGGATGSTQLDQTYTSTSWNPDSDSAAISAATTASMAAAGESDINSWDFSL
jgi:hypothetical protein